MNEKLQRVYYIIGIIQRITMVIVTILMCGAAYKIYSLSIKTMEMLDKYGIQIKDIQETIEKLYKMIDKSWFF